MLVAGVDSSTQSCKVVIRDAHTGELVRSGRAPHPEGTEVFPEEWRRALRLAFDDAGGLDGVSAISLAAQQHGMVLLDGEGGVIRRALLWNDTRSAGAASDLVAELGAERWASGTGSVPVASFTVAKLRWVAEHEPKVAARAAVVCLPHDWLTRELSEGYSAMCTDRGDASGTGEDQSLSAHYRATAGWLSSARQPGGLCRCGRPDRRWTGGRSDADRRRAIRAGACRCGG